MQALAAVTQPGIFSAHIPAIHGIAMYATPLQHGRASSNTCPALRGFMSVYASRQHVAHVDSQSMIVGCGEWTKGRFRAMQMTAPSQCFTVHFGSKTRLQHPRLIWCTLLRLAMETIQFCKEVRNHTSHNRPAGYSLDPNTALPSGRVECFLPSPGRTRGCRNTVGRTSHQSFNRQLQRYAFRGAPRSTGVTVVYDSYAAYVSESCDSERRDI